MRVARVTAWSLGLLVVAALVGLVMAVVAAIPGSTTVSAPLGSAGQAVVGTLTLSALGLVVATPLGIAAGVWLAEYEFPGRGGVRTLVVAMEGVPSVVYGLAGALVYLGGGSLVVAGCTLGVLVIPGVIRTTGAALEEVPAVQRAAALSLGMDRYQVVSGVLLPSSWPGILAGVSRAAVRCLGATAPLLVLGVGLDDGAFQALTHRVFALAGEGAPLEARVAALGLLLAVVAVRWAGVRARRSP